MMLKLRRSVFLYKNEIAVSIDDLNAAFFELPGYKGHQSATIVLEGADDVIFEISPITKMVRIYDLEVRKEGTGKDKSIEVTFKLSPGGLIKAKCKVIKLELNSPRSLG